MPTLLLTGGSGLLALNWARVMAERFDVCLALHRRAVALSWARSLAADLAVPEALLDDVRPEVVVHTAGMTSVEECERNPGACEELNVAVSARLSRACASRDIQLVHISTDHLFDGSLPMLDEKAEVQPVNAYGRSKAASELAVLQQMPAALVVRTNFYGWGPRYRRSLSDRIVDSLRSGTPIRLFDDVHFTPVHMDALVHAAHDLLAGGASGIYNVTGDDRLSKYEFGLHIARQFGFDETLVTLGQLSDASELVKRPHEMSLSNRKATERLGRSIGGPSVHLSHLAALERDPRVREIQSL